MRRAARTSTGFGRRLAASEEGSATVEFVLMFPLFMLLMLSSIELGITMTRYMMLERGIDQAVRQVRLGAGRSVGPDDLRRMICDHAAIVPDCMNQVKLEMIREDLNAWRDPDPTPDCVDRGEEVTPNRTFQNGTDHELLVLRVCALFDPWFPTTGLGHKLSEGGTKPYALVSSSAFVMEPL